MGQSLRIECHQKLTVGSVIHTAILTRSRARWYGVADGFGMHGTPEQLRARARSAARRALQRSYEVAILDADLRKDEDPSESLRVGIETAHLDVGKWEIEWTEEYARNRSLERVASLVAAWFPNRNGVLTVGCVGLGQAYLLRGVRLRALFEQRPLAEKWNGRTLYRQVLGGHLEPVVDVASCDLEDGDRILLASTTVSTSERAVHDMLLRAESPEQALDALHILGTLKDGEGRGLALLTVRRQPVAKKGQRDGVSYAARSHVGHLRLRNEDAFRLDPTRGLYVIADGMGGHQAGAEAAREAVDTIASSIPPDHCDAEATLAAALHRAHRVVSAHFDGRATTADALLLRDGRAYLAHIGDSRVYLWRAGNLKRLTRDHSKVAEMVQRGELSEAEALRHPERNVVTRALGAIDPFGGNAGADVESIDIAPGDVFLLCTDGLSGPVALDKIALTIEERRDDLPAAADRLITQALAAGGPDNVTVVLVHVGGLCRARSRATRLHGSG